VEISPPAQSLKEKESRSFRSHALHAKSQIIFLNARWTAHYFSRTKYHEYLFVSHSRQGFSHCRQSIQWFFSVFNGAKLFSFESRPFERRLWQCYDLVTFAARFISWRFFSAGGSAGRRRSKSAAAICFVVSRKTKNL
jgi:hypothetical protein